MWTKLSQNLVEAHKSYMKNIAITKDNTELVPWYYIVFDILFKCYRMVNRLKGPREIVPVDCSWVCDKSPVKVSSREVNENKTMILGENMSKSKL